MQKGCVLVFFFFLFIISKREQTTWWHENTGEGEDQKNGQKINVIYKSLGNQQCWGKDTFGKIQ